MKKNLVSVLIYLTVAALIVCTVSVAAASFVDVPEDAYYADAAERMADRGILSGFGDGYYYGNLTVTRAQIAALVCKMLGKANEAASLAGKTAFVDVPETNWSTGYVNYAVANGIISGDGDGNFRPDDPVKYEEVVKVVVCVLGLDENVKIDPTDWSKEFIEAADKANLTANLAGKKGEYMMRSDIAVICDAAMTVLDEMAEETSVATTTKKNNSTSGTTTTAPKDETEPEETTTEAFEEVTEPAETTTVTTEATTTATTEATTTEATTRPVVTAPPAPVVPDDDEDEGYYTTGEDEGEGF